MKNLLIGLIFVLCSTFTFGQNLQRLIANSCGGKTLTLDCGAGFAVVVYETIYGARTNDNGQCEYTSGDCFEYKTITSCGVDVTKCTNYLASATNLPSCQNRKADYQEVRYYCVPINVANNFEICNTAEITQQQGLIKSPSYPSYRVTSGICTLKINVPSGKSLNIWMTDVNILKKDSLENCKDYIRITDSTGTYDICGTDRPVFIEKLCSNVIYISYEAVTPTPTIFPYKGFKLYYEVRDLGPSTSCPNQTPSPPPTVDTTPTTVTTLIDPTTVIASASEYYELQVCKSKTVTLNAPSSQVVYIEDIQYRVQTLQALCQSPSDLHCKSPYPLTCNLKQSCSFNLVADYTVEDCSNKKADYIYGVYRFIPIESRIKYSICDTSLINGDSNPNGVIISKNYPNYAQNVDCTLNIRSTNQKAFKFYITDINIEDTDNCDPSYVQLNDGIKYNQKYCGSTSALKSYAFISCSNNLEIKYKTSGNNNNDYRGFRAYYELIDIPIGCIPTTPTTRPTTTTAVSDEVISQVITTGGNAGGKPCYFPFTFNSFNYDTCQNDGSSYWCSVTDNYDRDRIRGDCSPGLTTNQKFSLCSGKFRTFSCPKGYLINLNSVEGIQTTDDSCDETKIKCAQSLYSSVQAVAGGKQSYRLAATYLLPSCSNVKVSVMVIDYTCIPDNVPYVKSYDVCNTQQINENSGIIYSPNYPNSQTNLNCKVKISSGFQKLINVYSVSTELQATNQECTESYIQINNGDKFCGSRKSGLITQKCGTGFDFTYVVGTKGYKGFKVFYQITDVVDPLQCVEPETPDPSITTTNDPSQTQPPYVIQGIASGTQTIVNCKLTETITCPVNYVISLRKYFYGRSTANNCFYTQGDCISFSNQNLKCSGQRTCNIPTYFVYMPECVSFATYLQVEYECIPTNLPRKPMCAQIFTERNAIISSPNYPIYDENLNCKARVLSDSNSIIKAYILNLSINKDCTRDSITFSESGSVAVPLCGQLVGALAYETCNGNLDINLVTTSANDNTFTGVQIYYEKIAKPNDFVCVEPTTTSTKPTTTTSTRTTTTTTIATYLGFASPVMDIVRCKTDTIYCPANYILVIRSSFYGVKNSAGCDYDPTDCFGVHAYPSVICPGLQSCTISFNPAVNQVPECNKRIANYFFLEYQCIPTKNAGKPPSASNIEFCTPPTVQHVITPGSGAIIQSEKFPTYPSSTINCIKNITTSPGYALTVYLTAASFPGKSDCNGTKDYIIISDGFERFRFCSSTNQPKYLMQSRSNWITVEFSTGSTILPLVVYKGFQIYVETVSNSFTISTTNYPRSTFSTPPIIPGLASADNYVDMCQLETRNLTCPKNYVIVVLRQFIINSKNGCRFTSGDCREPTDLVSTTCAGKQSCNIYFPITPITLCGRGNADGLEFIYQCVPASPSGNTKPFTCNDKIENEKNGFIQSPKYPNYSFGENCEISLTPSPNTRVRFYLIDLALSQSCLTDLLAIDDNLFCENEDGNSRYVYSSSDPVKIRYKSLTQANDSVLETIRGFRIYFEAVSTDTTNTMPFTRTRDNNPFTKTIYLTRIPKENPSNSLLYFTLGIGIPAILLVIVILLLLNKYGSRSSGDSLRIKYSNDKGGKLNDDIKSFSNPNLE